MQMMGTAGTDAVALADNDAETAFYTVANSGVFRGATVRCPPLWPDHENYLQATLCENVRFLPFSSNFFLKWANLRLLLNLSLIHI